MCLGRTALDKAISEGHSETAEVLRENGKSFLFKPQLLKETCFLSHFLFSL